MTIPSVFIFFGLLLNTMGGILFVIVSNSDAYFFAEILSMMKDTYGKYDSNRERVVPLIDHLISSKKRNRIWTNVGWICFIAGFILQLIPLFI